MTKLNLQHRTSKLSLRLFTLGFILAGSSPSYADVISGPNQIIPSTTMSAPMNNFPISEIADGVSDAANTQNGYVGGDGRIGQITLDLDKKYDLSAFYLWNDINIRGESVSRFNLEFFGGQTLLGTYSPPAAIPANQPNMQTFTFPEVKNVDRVKFNVTALQPGSSPFRIEIREVALEGTVSKPTIITCCPPSSESETIIAQFNEISTGPALTSPTRLVFSPTPIFKQRMQWEINSINAVNPQVTKIVVAFYLRKKGDPAVLGTAYASWSANPANVNGTPSAMTAPAIFFATLLQNNTDYEVQVATGLEDAKGSIQGYDYGPDCRNSGGFKYGDTASPNARPVQSTRGFSTSDGKIIKPAKQTRGPVKVLDR